MQGTLLRDNRREPDAFTVTLQAGLRRERAGCRTNAGEIRRFLRPVLVVVVACRASPLRRAPSQGPERSSQGGTTPAARVAVGSGSMMATVEAKAVLCGVDRGSRRTACRFKAEGCRRSCTEQSKDPRLCARPWKKQCLTCAARECAICDRGGHATEDRAHPLHAGREQRLVFEHDHRGEFCGGTFDRTVCDGERDHE